MISRVSVVIPAYNAERYLDECLESVLNQSYHGTEVIVIDDGSTDGTPFVARSFRPRIRYRRQENQGVAGALNAGIALSTGDYVALVASDDGLCPGAIAEQARQLDRYPNVGMVHGGAEVIDRSGNVLERTLRRSEPAYQTSEAAVRELLAGNSVICSSVMIRRAIFERLGGFRQEFVPGEDWELWLRVAARHDVVYLPRPIARRRIHDASLTAGFTVESMLASHERVLRSLFSETPLASQRDLEAYAYAANDRTVAALAAALRDRPAFLNHMTRALCDRPSLALDGETWGVLFDGAKAFLPQPLVRAARDARRRIRPRRVQSTPATE